MIYTALHNIWPAKARSRCSNPHAQQAFSLSWRDHNPRRPVLLPLPVFTLASIIA